MTHSSLIRRGVKRGFTLIEIILVVVIIMTLAGVVGPRLVGQGRKQRVNITKIQMNSLKASLQQFETQMSRFPTTQEGLSALMTRPSSIEKDEWPGKLVDKMPKDGFGAEFKYAYPSEHGMDYDLSSPGPDKKFGTSDDINNWDADGNASGESGTSNSEKAL